MTMMARMAERSPHALGSGNYMGLGSEQTRGIMQRASPGLSVFSLASGLRVRICSRVMAYLSASHMRRRIHACLLHMRRRIHACVLKGHGVPVRKSRKCVALFDYVGWPQANQRIVGEVVGLCYFGVGPPHLYPVGTIPVACHTLQRLLCLRAEATAEHVILEALVMLSPDRNTRSATGGVSLPCHKCHRFSSVSVNTPSVLTRSSHYIEYF
jgi:hypothetical protein